MMIFELNLHDLLSALSRLVALANLARTASKSFFLGETGRFSADIIGGGGVGGRSATGSTSDCRGIKGLKSVSSLPNNL